MDKKERADKLRKLSEILEDAYRIIRSVPATGDIHIEIRDAFNEADKILSELVREEEK